MRCMLGNFLCIIGCMTCILLFSYPDYIFAFYNLCIPCVHIATLVENSLVIPLPCIPYKGTTGSVVLCSGLDCLIEFMSKFSL